MKTLCITGVHSAELSYIEAIFVQAGMALPRPSQRNETLTMSSWHDQIQSRIQEITSEQGPVELGRVWEQLASDLFVANLDQPVWGWSNVQSIALLDFWQAFDPQLRFVLVTSSAQRFIANALESGEAMPALSVLLEQWAAQHLQILQFYHRFPQKAVLVDIDHCIDNPAGLLKVCQQSWQLDLSKVHFPNQPAPTFSTMSRFLAESLSQTDKQWLPLQNELLSSATPIGTLWKQPSQIGIGDAVRAYRDEKPKVIEPSVSTKELEQLRAAQSALTELQARTQELNTQLNDAHAQREQSAAQLKDTQEQMKDTKEEVELLLAQLHQVQEELENYFLKYQDSKKDAESTEATVKVLNNEKDALKAQLDKSLADLKSSSSALSAAKSALNEQQKRAQELNTQLNDARTQREQLDAQLKDSQEQRKDTQEEAELLLAQLHQVQEELENYFLKYQDSKQELEVADMRWKRMLQRVPDYFDIGSVEVQCIEGVGTETLRWRLKGLEAAGRKLPELELTSFIVDGIAGLEIPRRMGEHKVIQRWPAVAASDDALVIAWIGDAQADDKLTETLRQLGRSDWDLIQVIITALITALNTPAMLKRGEGIILDYTPKALSNLQSKLGQMPSVFRFDELTLMREQVNHDYEHLWLNFRHVAIGNKRLLDFDFRISCANLRPKVFGQYPKLEFPETSGRAAITEWFDESYDDFGPKLELRFALPESMDMQVWELLSASDREFLETLVQQMPAFLSELETSGLKLKRGWDDWQQLVREVGRILKVGSDNLLLKAVTPVKPKRTSSRAKREIRS